MASHEAARLRELRLTALAADPEAFGSTHLREAAEPMQWWERWAALSDDGADERTFVLADPGDRWVGMVLVRRAEDDLRKAAVNAMWVAAQARGRRGARLLCDACAAWAQERGLRELALTVIGANDAALRAYRAAGFAALGDVRPPPPGRTLHELIMTRPV